MRTQKEVRQSFWGFLKEANPELYTRGKRSKRQNEQVCDIRLSFIDYVEQLGRDGIISDKLKNRATL